MRKVSNESFISFSQLFEQTTSTYTYIIADGRTRDALIIDPVINTVARDLQLVKQLNLRLRYARTLIITDRSSIVFFLLFSVNTHVHADHITGSGRLKSLVPQCRSVISKMSGAKADIYIEDGEKIQIGDEKQPLTIECRSTPGHTNGTKTRNLLMI